MLIKNKDILIIGKGQTKRLDNILLATEAEYSVTFSRLERKFCLSRHFNGSSHFLFANNTKIHHFKAKDFKIKGYHLFLRKDLSKDLSEDIIKNTGLNGYVYEL